MTGEVWSCPHCGERILRSMPTCPACQRRLRGGAMAAAGPGVAPACPLRVYGTIRHPGDGPPWEYSVVIEVQDERGGMVARRVVGVGALGPGEARTVALRVELFAPEGSLAVGA